MRSVDAKLLERLREILDKQKPAVKALKLRREPRPSTFSIKPSKTAANKTPS